jgi:hypothetical protein
MNERRTCIVLLGVFLVVAAILAFVYGSRAGSDEVRYRRSIRNVRLADRVRNACRCLPDPISRPLDRLAVKPFRAYAAEEEALLASGFLTNLFVTLTNASARFGTTNLSPVLAQISRRMHAAVPGNDFLPFSLQRDFQSNVVSVKVTCRTKDVPLLQKTFKEY